MTKYKELLDKCEEQIEFLIRTMLMDSKNKSVRAEEQLTALVVARNYLLDKLEYKTLWEDKGDNK